jgi:hypothetical protein
MQTLESESGESISSNPYGFLIKTQTDTITAPFSQDINRAESKLRTALTLYNNNLVRISQSILGRDIVQNYNFSSQVANTERLFDSIRSLIQCDDTSRSYKHAVRVLCDNSL